MLCMLALTSKCWSACQIWNGSDCACRGLQSCPRTYICGLASRKPTGALSDSLLPQFVCYLEGWRWCLWLAGFPPIYYGAGLCVHLLELGVEARFLTSRQVMYYAVSIKVPGTAFCPACYELHRVPLANPSQPVSWPLAAEQLPHLPGKLL